jgi:1,4-alpha-glucan branching enzyme
MRLQPVECITFAATEPSNGSVAARPSCPEPRRDGPLEDLYRRLGAHECSIDGVDGVRFAVWAPNARAVSVVGDFNGWHDTATQMSHDWQLGVWTAFVPGLAAGALYKLRIVAQNGAVLPLKADPFAFYMQQAPGNACIVTAETRFPWSDAPWMARRGAAAAREAPISIYEVHLGSWRRHLADNRPYSYRELADALVPYVADLGFTHIELLPVSEHPFDGSWGYQPVGLYAPTSRYGSPDDFRYLVDRCHAAGIGVILDWAAGHFPDDPHGLASFDGTCLYEHLDPRQGRHADWGSLIFNLGRHEVADYLLANALYWLEEFHIDALRVDAVASMLYLDYSREPGEWVPNVHGGRENLESIAFLRRMNHLVYERCPGAFTIAEESTAWPMVSRPVYMGGLGFGYKWNMGWMNDTLRYIARDPVHRKHHHEGLTFPLVYAWSENYVLALSHDEVVHGKRSLVGRMPGDAWQKFANLRAYLAYMFMHPGKKLLFMGDEIAQKSEWSHMRELEWGALTDPAHGGIQRLVRDLNRLYRELPALHERDCEPDGFQWIDCNDSVQSVLTFLRLAPGEGAGRLAVVACNFTPVPRHGYRVGVPQGGLYSEILNTDAGIYGGGNVGNGGEVRAFAVPSHGRTFSLELTLPPLATVVLSPKAG